MLKTYFYLLLVIIFLPTFGFTYLTKILSQNVGIFELWKCFFLPDSGAAMINYTIFVALVGNAIEFATLPKKGLFLIKLCFSKSKA